MLMIFNLFTIMISGVILYLIALLAKSPVFYGSAVFDDFFGLLERSAALDAFLMFIFESVTAVTMISAVFACVSNHSVLSLDIIYLISLIMLILFHILKSEGPYPVKA